MRVVKPTGGDDDDIRSIKRKCFVLNIQQTASGKQNMGFVFGVAVPAGKPMRNNGAVGIVEMELDERICEIQFQIDFTRGYHMARLRSEFLCIYYSRNVHANSR